MKFRRQPDRHRVRAVAGAVLGVDMGGELGDLALGQLAGELTHHQPFKLDPDIKGIAGFLPAWRRHDGDPVAAKLDEAFRGELSQRMPRDGAADAEAFAKRILGQFRAGLECLSMMARRSARQITPTLSDDSAVLLAARGAIGESLKVASNGGLIS